MNTQRTSRLICRPSQDAATRVMSYGQFIQQTLPITICGLRPFSEYDVSVRVRRVDVQPWSEWSTLTTVTDEDTPLIGPLLTSTSFYTRGCSIGRREIFVYWQKPNRLELQGHLTGFEVEVQPDLKVSFEKNLESTRNYAHFLTLDCDLEYNISVYSTTKVGRSQSPSVIFVPKYNKNSQHVAGFQIEDFLNSTRKLHVTWEPFTLSNATLVVYTCHENTIPETCSNDYTHIEVDASVGSLHLDQVDSKDTMFGYALKLASGQSGGLEWTQCVYNRRNKPREPLGLQVVQGKDFGSLDITWNPEPCNKKTQVLVQSYTIYVCDGNTKPSLEKCQKLNHRATDNMVTVSSLQDDHVYNVTIQAVTPFNLSGDVASFKVGRTKYRYGEAIILIIVFVIVGIVLILASVFYCTSKCCNSKKKFVGMSQWFTDDIIKENKSPTLTDGKGPIGGETVMPSSPKMPTQRSESSSTTSDEGISSNTSDDGPEPQEPYVHMAQTTDEPITPTTESQTSSLRPNNGPPPFEVYNTAAGEMGEQVGETDSELSDVVVVVLAGGQGGCDPGAINSEIDAGLNVSTGCDSQNDITDNQQTPGYVVITEMNNSVDAEVNDAMVSVECGGQSGTDGLDYILPFVPENQESSNGQPDQYFPDYQSNNGQPAQYSTDYQSNNGQPAQYSTDYQSNNGHSHPESNDNLRNGHFETLHLHSDPSKESPDSYTQWSGYCEDCTDDQPISYAVNQPVITENQFHSNHYPHVSSDNNQNVSLDQNNHHVLGQMSFVNENQTFSLVSHQMPQHFSDPSLCSNDQSHYHSDMPSFQNRLSPESCSASSNDSLSSSENDILTFVNHLNLSPTNTTECVNSQSLPNTNTVLDENGQSTLGNYQTSFQNYTLTSDIDRTSQSTLMIPNINNYIASQYHHNPTECNTSPSSNC
ncbi:hypothetical protein Btru_057072 [Bulinus truncatus]|nr:hypothetical protein Btru_057072 [Bulinus truncatus]